MRIFKSLGIILLSATVLAGCETLKPGDDKAADAAVDDKGAQARGAGTGTGFAGDALSDPSSLLSKRVVYFDYDSSVISPATKAIIEAHAAYLAKNPKLSVVLEGHADERGTREYNIALGERRATGIQRLLAILGVGDGQLQSVSYGEERPAAPGHDESAWRMNRRVEIVYPR